MKMTIIVKHTALNRFFIGVGVLRLRNCRCYGIDGLDLGLELDSIVEELLIFDFEL